MRVALSLAALALCACASTKTTPPEPARVSPAAGERADEQTVSPCVQACTDGRRTEAIDWAVIVAECEASCASDTSP